MKNPSRKFIDLIRDVSSKWANWDPPNQIKVSIFRSPSGGTQLHYHSQVGDYGTINKETGQFEVDGNIYEDPSIVNLTAAHPPLQTCPENSFIASSSGVKRHELTLTHEL